VKATISEVRTALDRKDGPVSTKDLAEVIGCDVKDVYDTVMRMWREGLVRRKFRTEGTNRDKRKCWVYWLAQCPDPSNVTPAPYPSVILGGEWKSDLLTHYALNSR